MYSEYAVTVRIIPAHAGQTPVTTCSSTRTTDHPRACGANKHNMIRSKGCFGSSPRMRGKLFDVGSVMRMRRIIPAHAGQTRAQSVAGTHTHGSSPRMRGKRLELLTGDAGLRIIPAHAGQTRHRGRRRGAERDHPRACGANDVDFPLYVPEGGSSPRMRGKPSSSMGFNTAPRIIPAHAGQTPRNSSCSPATPDHPRACGANPAQWRQCEEADGSSPRMRGKPRHSRQGAGREWIIPAHAGQTIG